MTNKKKNEDAAAASRRYLAYGIAAVVVVIAAVIVAAVLISKAHDYVATVGTEKVSRAEYTFFLKSVQTQLQNSVGITNWNDKYGNETALEYAKKTALEWAKETKIQVMEARKQGVTLSSDDLSKIDTLVKQMIPAGTKLAEQNAAYKSEYGVGKSELTGIYREQYLADKLRTKIIGTYKKPTEADIRAYYDKNPDKFKSSMYRTDGEEAVWAQHILISTIDQTTQKELPADQVAAAKKKAEDILVRIKNGEDFSKLVKEDSQDTGSTGEGRNGDYVFGKGKMITGFENAAFNQLQPGQVTPEPVKTQYGYHIIKLLEKIPKGQPVSYKCAKEYYEYALSADTITNDQYRQQLDKWKAESQYALVKNDKIYDAIKEPV